MTTAHTPTPWTHTGRVDSIYGADGVEVCTLALYGYHLPPIARANAEHIINCVNSHDALTARVAELEAALREARAGFAVIANHAPNSLPYCRNFIRDHAHENFTMLGAVLAKGQS